MIAKKTLAAAVVALGALTAVPASAASVHVQFGPGYGWHDGRGDEWRDHRRHRWLSPREVRHELRDRGYRQIRYLDRRGAIYQARASKGHRDFYLVINARNGNILSRHRI